METLDMEATAKTVAGHTATEWPFIDSGDIAFHLQVLTLDGRYDNVPGGLVARAMYGDAVAYCSQERADYVSRTARYLYTPGEVLALLETLPDTEPSWANPPSPEGLSVSISTGNMIVSLWDVQSAVWALPGPERAIILHHVYGAVRAVDRRSLARAVRRMADYLNGA